MNKVSFAFVCLHFNLQLGILASEPVAPLIECSKHSVYTVCGPNCPQTCEWFNTTCTMTTKKCTPGCYCKDGYVRINNKCYKGSKVCCQENEIYDIQDPACEKNCYNYYEHCQKSSRNVKRCYCKNNFVRNKHGKCIPHNQCSVKCDRNHEFYDSCPKTCTKTCDDPNGIGEWDVTPCKPYCVCRDGYVRDKNHDCILHEHCPVKCKTNEVYSNCGFDVICNKDLTSEQCEAGCFCSHGYVRAKINGECIPQSACAHHKCRKQEEYLKCGPACPQTCDWFNKPCTLLAPSRCHPGCYCKNGYVRYKNNCVKGKAHCCPTHEIYTNACPSCEKTCANPSGTCTETSKKHGCYCDNGYVRNESTGTCIPVSDCPHKPPECKTNEVYLNCGPTCPQTCEFMFNTCIIHTSVCRPGCYCQDGYVRLNNECVRDKVCCAVNEILKHSNPSCEKTCTNPGKTCIEVTRKRGCYCEDGYVRNEATGTCTLKSDCPRKPIVCQKNEVYLSCGPTCPQTCEYLLHTCAINIDICKPGCYCEDGYVRINNECVRGNKVCCPKNEILKHYHSSCENTCEDTHYKECDLERYEERRCYCMDGYVRNNAGNCVPPSDCPVNKCDTSLEVYDPCTKSCTKTCSNPEGSGHCKIGKAECVCIDGYLRNEDQNCVLPHNCPRNHESEHHCGKDEHYSQCGIDNMCNKADMAVACCSGCFCNHGYARDIKTGKCIPDFRCSYKPSCLPNEEYLACGPACPKTCSKNLQNILCMEKCVEGCFCRNGMLRNKHGLCVKESNCWINK